MENAAGQLVGRKRDPGLEINAGENNGVGAGRAGKRGSELVIGKTKGGATNFSGGGAADGPEYLIVMKSE